MADTTGFWVVRRSKRLWTDEETRSICLQTVAPDVSGAQVARRYALNANMIFKWLRDARHVPGSAQGALDAPVFSPVEIVSPTRSDVARAILSDNTLPGRLFEIKISGGHRLRVSGVYDPEALARLIRGLSG